MKKSVFFVCIFVFSVVSLLLIGNLVYNRIFAIAYENEVAYASQITGVNENLIFAVIKSESNFNKDSVSNKGAIGLMQILPTTAEYMKQKYTVEEYATNKDLFLPQTNIIIGAYYLKYLQEKYSDLSSVLACYNAGEGNVSAWLKDKKYSTDGIRIVATPYKATNHYIDKVGFYLKIYQKSNK